MLAQEVSLTTTSMIGPEIMETNDLWSDSIHQLDGISSPSILQQTGMLSCDVGNSRTENTFKNRLDAYWENDPPDDPAHW